MAWLTFYLFVSVETMQQNNNMTQVNWWPSTLVMYCQKFYHRNTRSIEKMLFQLMQAVDGIVLWIEVHY